jgi:hypothetical protein
MFTLSFNSIPAKTGVKINQHDLRHAIAGLQNTVPARDGVQAGDKLRRSRDNTCMVEVFAPGNRLAEIEWNGLSARLSGSIATF